MNILKTMLWTTVGTMAATGVGLIIEITRRYRERVFEKEFEQHELQVLEGEGGICLG
ncbi:MAG: hypothetical protein JWM68_501 [Verrucomicrobiales bacterium]|nr:hypothetical protein [Verrucomicrobiales bacterium]